MDKIRDEKQSKKEKKTLTIYLLENSLTEACSRNASDDAEEEEEELRWMTSLTKVNSLAMTGMPTWVISVLVMLQEQCLLRAVCLRLVSRWKMLGHADEKRCAPR